MADRTTQLYDVIGSGYRERRRPDPRIAAAITRALGRCDRVVNVGAGAGSYEPVDRRVVAVEPSVTMIRQRPAGAAPVVRADAVRLPFADRAFDAALAILTVHHWQDPARGLAELVRVARDRVVVLTWDPDAAAELWLLDYVPGLRAIDRGIFPTMAGFTAAFGAFDVVTLPIPHDCTDGFTGAYWRRPEAYLDAAVRAGMSTFARVRDAGLGLARLEADLADRTWRRRYAELLDRDALDVGYRILIARSPRV